MAKETTTSNKYDGPELLPPQGHEEVGKRIFEILAEIIEDKVNLGLHDKWSRNYELYKNRHWRRKPKSNVPLVSANLIFTHIQRTANTLTDNNPIFNVGKIGSQDAQNQINPEYFDDLQHTAEHWWIDQEQQDDLDSSIRNGEQYGICIEKVVFNPKLESGLGEVETVIVDPFHFGFYPVKMTNLKKLQQAEAILHFYPMSIREAKRTWPDFADEIKPDSEIFRDLGDERRELAGKDAKTSGSISVTIASAVKQIFNYFSGSAKDTDDVLIVECWCKDYGEKKSTTKDEENGQEIEKSEPVYPGDIRYIVACNGGKVVMEDRGNPNINPNLSVEETQKTYLYDKYPFCAVNSIKDTVCAWGMDDVEQLEMLNIELDKSISQLVLLKDRAARLKIINPKTSGVSNDEFSNTPGVIRPNNANEAQAIRYLEFPQVPIDIMQSISLFKEMFFLVAGTFDLDQAQVPGKNVIAFKAIAALLERASTMMRGKIRAYSRLIRERGRMYLSHVQNFYTEDRWITFNDKNGKEVSKQINGQNLRIPAKLTVVTGSTMPISKIQQREEAIDLWKLKAIDRAKLLESLDISDRSEILQRMEIGPLGQAMQKLQSIGVPPELTNLFAQVVQAEPEKLQKAIEGGQVPTFVQVMTQIMQQSGGQMPGSQPGGPEQADMAIKQVEAKKVIAEAQKIDADRALVMEKINTERIDQRVKVVGVQFDEEQMKINRAKVVADVEDMSKKSDLARTQMVSNLDNSPGYNEKGLRSNNKE